MRSVSFGPVVLLSASGLGDIRTTDGDVTTGEPPSTEVDLALDISNNRSPRDATLESTEAGRDICGEKGSGGLIRVRLLLVAESVTTSDAAASVLSSSALLLDSFSKYDPTLYNKLYCSLFIIS